MLFQLALTACSIPSATDTASRKAGPAVGVVPISASGREVQTQEKLVFFDSDAFDIDLAQAMQDQPAEVSVAFAGPISLSSFPPRINVWLAEVKHSDGSVTAIDPSAPSGQNTRGLGMLFDLIDLFVEMHARHEAAQRLALAHAYNARILYDSATGYATQLVFSRRSGEAPP